MISELHPFFFNSLKLVKNHILSVYIIGMNTKKSIVFLEQLARRLDEFEIPLCLMVGEKDDELEAQLKTLGCVAVWCSSFEDCREQMQTGKVKVVFILENNKAVGLSLVKWMKKEGAEHLVVILGENRDKETEAFQYLFADIFRQQEEGLAYLGDGRCVYLMGHDQTVF